MREQGAETMERVTAQLPLGALEELFAGRYLVTVPTELGNLVVLGGAGRRAVGLSPSYRSTPDAAALQVARRRVREELEARGWQYLKSPQRSLLAFLRPEGTKAYVVVRLGGYSARSVRRLLRSHGSLLVREGSSLVVVCRSPLRLKGVVGRAEGLVEVLHLDDYWKEDASSNAGEPGFF